MLRAVLPQWYDSGEWGVRIGYQRHPCQLPDVEVERSKPESISYGNITLPRFDLQELLIISVSCKERQALGIVNRLGLNCRYLWHSALLAS